MDNQIIADPEKIDQFATALTFAWNDMHAELEKLGNALHVLNRTWDDDQFRDFQGHFAGAWQLLEEFATEVRAVAPHLSTDANHLRDYRGLTL